MTDRVPRVSIGLPVYNGARYLPEALDSLVSQTFEDIEIVICDNASTDDTEEICRRYAARDGRIRYVRHPENLGAGANFTCACEQARGPFFKWATCDDLCAPTLVERCLETLERHPGGILAYAKAILIDANGDTLREFDDNMHLPDQRPGLRFAHILSELALCNVQYGVMRTPLVRKTRLMGKFLAADEVLIAEMSLYGTFHEVPERLFRRRFHPEAQSSCDQEGVQVFYDPKRRGKRAYREWRLLYEHTKSILRARVPLRDRLTGLRTLGQRLRWYRKRLWEEIRWAGRPPRTAKPRPEQPPEAASRAN